jgi:hypothetical protein
MSAMPGLGALVAVSATADCVQRTPEVAPSTAFVAVMVWSRSAEGGNGAANAVQVYEGGRAVVQAQRRAADWIVNMFCRQGARLQLGNCGDPTMPPVPASPAAPSTDSSTARLPHVLREGGEAHRYGALLQSRTAQRCQRPRVHVAACSEQARLAELPTEKGLTTAGRLAWAAHWRAHASSTAVGNGHRSSNSGRKTSPCEKGRRRTPVEVRGIGLDHAQCLVH